MLLCWRNVFFMSVLGGERGILATRLRVAVGAVRLVPPGHFCFATTSFLT